MLLPVVSYHTFNGENTLVYYASSTVENAQKEVDAINAEKPTKLWTGERVDWSKVEYFYVNVQEEMY